MADDQVVVEFQHTSWLTPERVPETLGLPAEKGVGHVVVDAPQVGTGTAPLVPAVTDPDLAYVRLHGRNTKTWFKKVETTGERFDYLCTEDELREWLPRVEELARRAAEVQVLFNNNRRNYAAVNVEQLMRLMGLLERPAEAGLRLQLPLLEGRT